MRAVIKHLIKSYYAIDDEVVTVEDGVISVLAFDENLAINIAKWLIGHMADRGLGIEVEERFMDYRVSIVPKRRNGTA